MDPSFSCSSYTVLVADDDAPINDLIRMYLADKGFRVLVASTGREAVRLFRTQTVHLVVLDIMMPDQDGWEVCRELRSSSDVPILMVTAKGESEDRLKGFGLGADDYVVKPFDPKELVARIISLLRRTYSSLRQVKPPASITAGCLRIETASRRVYVEEDLVELTPREYKLLLAFIQHPNQVLSREQLLDLVWGDDYDGEDRVVDATLKRLRHKLDTGGTAACTIETLRGAGYMYRPEV
ncbi:response regulator transcription factor [Gorillibacterium sp. sgz5001074]|uniref:response regulator transcription factor n=1 Tax=Gorillibacterium sp. sgz5001074 TaxID=3446695 RepID=UPI003F67EFD3